MRQVRRGADEEFERLTIELKEELLSSPTSASATVNGVLLRYWTWGGTGQPLVLLHGLASTHRIWDFVAPLLAQDFRAWSR